VRNPIDDAIAALRRGDQARAFALLRACLTRDPKDATAWLWMSEATPDIHRKIEALERFIQLAPDHPRVPSATARLQYLEAQVAKVSPPPLPSVSIRYEEDAPKVEEPPPPVAPSIIAPPMIEEPPPPRVTEPKPSLLRRTERVAYPAPEPTKTEPTIAPAPRTAVSESIPSSPMSLQTAPRPAYTPAMPDLLQSLLETAPMPRVRPDTPRDPSQGLETAPRRAIQPEEQSVIQSDLPVEAGLDETITPVEGTEAVSQSRATPWWAWTLMTLMTLQVFMLVYIIWRIENALAALGR
jgi:hypothetical protein